MNNLHRINNVLTRSTKMVFVSWPIHKPILRNRLKPILQVAQTNLYCTENNNESHLKNDGREDKKGSFAKAFERHNYIETTPKEEDPSFLQLLKNSKFIDLGDPEGKIVTGTIFHVVDQDLYVDFGWKFHCVVTKPAKNAHEYVRGAKVRLSLKDLELSTRFLGSDKDLTLLEADATLIGLIASPTRHSASETS